LLIVKHNITGARFEVFMTVKPCSVAIGYFTTRMENLYLTTTLHGVATEKTAP
jgi:hypothetical protein